MNEIELYRLLKAKKHLLNKQQYLTIKGQIRKGDLEGAYKGISNCCERVRARSKKEDR